jgi:putative membrane protein
MMWGSPDGWGWWMIFGGLWILLFWGVIIGLIVWGVTRLAGGRPERRDAEETPLEIARKRLARGEITREQFEELQKVLK